MKISLTFFLAFLCFYAKAINKTAVSNIDLGSSKGWQNPNNWNPVGVPQNGDVIIIPSGLTLSVKSNIYSGPPPNLKIYINGTLEFGASGVLNLGALSIVQLYNAASRIITNSAALEHIIIGGVIKYSAQNDIPIAGPAYAVADNSILTTAPPGAGFTPGVLPLQIASFNAIEKDGIVKINWTTTLENSTIDFELQRSSDGNDWKTIVNIPAKNSCQCATLYQFDYPFIQTGTSYFRLYSNEIDGKKTSSATVALVINANGSKDLTWTLNSSGTELKLLLAPSSFTFPIQLQLFNSSGHLVQETVMTANTIIDTRDLEKGIAFLLISDARGRHYKTKVIK